MPISPKSLPSPHPDDRRKLARFLKKLKMILQNIIVNPVNIIPGRFHEMIVYSWSGIEDVLRESISLVTPSEPLQPGFILNPESGLTAYHLDLKLEIFEQRYAELLDHAQQIFWFTEYSTLYQNQALDQTDGQIPSIQRPAELPRNPGDKNNPFWRMLRKCLKGCLIAAKFILDSLIKSSPLIESIKEFVEAITGCLDFADNYLE